MTALRRKEIYPPIWAPYIKIPGEINLSIGSIEGLKEKGVLATVTFRAKADAVRVSAGITQIITNCEQSKGEGKIETTPVINEEDKSFEEKIEVKPEIKSVSLKSAPTQISYITGKETFNPDCDRNLWRKDNILRHHGTQRN